MKISFCTTSMNRAHHLRETLPKNLADTVDWNQPGRFEFVVLDYSSTDGLQDWMTTEPALQPYYDAGILKFVRHEGAEFFRHSHAKNIAHNLATGDVVCNLDADNFVEVGFGEFLHKTFTVHPNTIVIANALDKTLEQDGYRGSTGRIALSRRNFYMVGGYDESPRFKGWSGEDFDLVFRAFRHFMMPTFIPDRKFLRAIPHSDMDRLKHTEYDNAEKEIARMNLLDKGSVLAQFRYFADALFWRPGRANQPGLFRKGQARIFGLGNLVYPKDKPTAHP